MPGFDGQSGYLNEKSLLHVRPLEDTRYAYALPSPGDYPLVTASSDCALLDNASDDGIQLEKRFSFDPASLPWQDRCRGLLHLFARQFTKFLLLLIPTFIESRLPNARPQPRRILPTSYLDGIRGIASFAVFLFHYFYIIHDVGHGWGAGPDYQSLFRLPFIRSFYGAGHQMVAVFFVVSGFALSLKPLQNTRRHDWSEFRRSLSSAAFRRFFRLFLPCLASTTLVFVLVRWRVYQYTAAFANDGNYLTHTIENHPVRDPNLRRHLKAFYLQWADWVNPWHLLPDHTAPPPPIKEEKLWSIATEYKASLVLFLTQLALSGFRPRWRLICVAGLVLVGFRYRQFAFLLFHAGMFLAELHLIRVDRERSMIRKAEAGLLPVNKGGDGYQRGTFGVSPLQQNSFLRRTFLSADCFYLVNFIMGWYLISTPLLDIEKTPGYRTIFKLCVRPWFINPPRYFGSIGAIQLVYAVSGSKPLQRLFDNRFSQYLGKISFMLYILHSLVIHTVGYATMMNMWKINDVAAPFAREPGFLTAFLVVLVALIWLSDIFYRLVDEPSVRFAKWLEVKLTVPEPLREEFR